MSLSLAGSFGGTQEPDQYHPLYQNYMQFIYALNAYILYKHKVCMKLSRHVVYLCKYLGGNHAQDEAESERNRDRKGIYANKAE